ncbi:nucleotidyltransferase [Thermosipho atlanticus]|uniref:tRNA(Met) cytidine acetate ligase n=1 Tax=Thermosipho atlanticus DSM 15807 TaxID=1123380 RepID=A0A1M5SLI0_9BACT|nr:nucleotidyltransferase [Thermosipho atlanticus]SHH39325.1 Predicted nucleotidyltransferase [Thermosipho atlanticus DSM 15807]
MKVLGLIVEYNPMHNGHLYHLNEAKKLINPDFTVAIMSGNFCQRGEPAIVNKYARTEMALRNGIDIVFELPTVFAIQDAGNFAFGAIATLDKLKFVTDFVFGSESNDVNFLNQIAEILYKQPQKFDTIIKRELKKGLSYPNARKYALQKFLKFENSKIEKLEKSNDILGIEYIHSLLKLKSKIKYHTIKRIGSNYNETELKGKISSATAIRNAIKNNLNFSATLPTINLKILTNEFENGRGPVFLESLESFVIPYLRTLTREKIEKIYGFKEGLDIRFLKAASNAGSIQEFLDLVKTKRFTYSRIRRLILYTLFNMKKEFVELSNTYGPQYLRILGFTKKGQKFLSNIKKHVEIPIISTASLYKKILNKIMNDTEKEWKVIPELYLWQFEIDILASNIYAFFYPNKSQRKSGMDFRNPIIIE